jgi:DNA-nicking Smr family endonuclease
MKRPPRFSIPELRASSRRKRALTEEERALWESVARHAKPLRKKPRVETPKTSGDGEAGAVVKSSVLKKSHAPAAVPGTKSPVPPLAPLGRRERSQLSRGRKDIEARLDLHGMTQERAHRALSGFLQRSHLDGLTLVLVITGKGKIGAESERGVLRRQVPRWLSHPEFRALVVGFEEASRAVTSQAAPPSANTSHTGTDCENSPTAAPISARLVKPK